MENGTTTSKFWESFQKETDSSEGASTVETVLIIDDILDTFDIPKGPMVSFTGDAGKLEGIDLKRVSVLPILKASLLEQFANSDDLIELRVNSSGEVTTYIVGGETSNFNSYYVIPSTSFRSSKVGVSITGRKPVLKRVVYDWKQIIGKDSTDNYTVWDATHLQSQCSIDNFTTAAVITYKDPLLETGTTSYNNGIKNMFELENQYQRIVGFAWNIQPDESLINDMVKIHQQSQSSVPVLLDQEGKGLLPDDTYPGYKLGQGAVSPSIGKSLRRRAFSGNATGNDCNVFEPPTGVPNSMEGPLEVILPIKEGLTYSNFRGDVVSKFMGVNEIFVVAVSLPECRGMSMTGKGLSGNTFDNTEVFVKVSDMTEEIYKLTSAEDYLIEYPETGSPFVFKIQFANNSQYNDNGLFGSHVAFYMDVNSPNLLDIFTGVPSISEPTKGYGTLLPVKGGPGGLLIKQLWVQVDLDTPSFLVMDPNGKAKDIAESLVVELSAITIEEREPPLAINGQLVENSPDDLPDNDPTTSREFTPTTVELAMQAMDSGRTISLNLASLDEDQTKTLSTNLYNLLKDDDGITYTHTCSPTEEPIIGSKGPNGGIVNSITYSYNDSGSYLITVVEGPKVFGDFAGLSGGLYYKKVETVNATGMILQCRGNHVDFLVRVDGYGDVWAINSYPGVLDIRDRVNVTINNNEVED